MRRLPPTGRGMGNKMGFYSTTMSLKVIHDLRSICERPSTQWTEKEALQVATAFMGPALSRPPKPSTLSDSTIEAEAIARFGNPVLDSEMGAQWCRYKEAFKQGAEFARQYIAQPGVEDEKNEQ